MSHRTMTYLADVFLVAYRILIVTVIVLDSDTALSHRRMSYFNMLLVRLDHPWFWLLHGIFLDNSKNTRYHHNYPLTLVPHQHSQIETDAAVFFVCAV